MQSQAIAMLGMPVSEEAALKIHQVLFHSLL